MTQPASGISDLLPSIESALDAACGFETGCPERLVEAIRYALLAPGKRLRPALVMMAAEACGGDFTEVMPGAVAVEMIHAYSLIHDDLPAMDDDDLRRGRPTVHIRFDQATAILAGDALLAHAFAHLAEEVRDPERASQAIAVLGRAAGPSRLVGGQMDDLQAASMQARLGDHPRRRLEFLESIHRRKTGALFAASLDLGCLLCGGDDQQRGALGRYAADIGLAFQVVDDLLDLTADDASLGKRTGKDATLGKLTYPGLLGEESARDKAAQLVQSARHEISVFGDAAWRLNWLAGYVLERTH